jgi:hypothetical protein
VKRSLLLGLWLSVSVTGLVVLTAAAPGEDKALKKQMNEAHKGKAAPLTKLTEQLQADQPDWTVVAGSLAKLQDMGKALKEAKAKSKAQVSYNEALAALEEAAKKNDKTAAAAAHKQLMQSCNGCHYGGPPLKEK